VDDTQIAEALQTELQDVRDSMDLLESAGHTETANSHDGYCALLTGRGRIWLRASWARSARLVPTWKGRPISAAPSW